MRRLNCPYAWMGLIILYAVGSASAQPPDLAEGGPPIQRPAADVPQPAAGDANSTLSSDALAEWLVILFSEAQTLSVFGQERAQDERVRSFAQKSAADHAEFVQSLQQAIVRRQREEPSAVGANVVTQELQSVAERLRGDDEVDEVDVTVEARGDEVVVEPAAAPAEQRARPRREAGQRRAEAIERRREVRDAEPQPDEARGEASDRRILRREGVLQRLRAAADDRERGAARERIREALPALREQLPELLNLVAVAIEEGSSVDYAAWLPLQREFEQRLSQSLREELAQYDGQEFDQAYLGYEILAHRKLATALDVVRQRADADLRSTLDSRRALEEAHLQEARQLVRGTDRAGGRPNQQ